MSEYTLGYDIRELSFAELDEVSGGDASVAAMLVGNATVIGSFLLDVLPNVFATASITARITPFLPGPATVSLAASAHLPD
jgi:hypothetical protein